MALVPKISEKTKKSVFKQCASEPNLSTCMHVYSHEWLMIRWGLKEVHTLNLMNMG